MAEQLLDGAQVGAALEQVGGERVAQRVRRRRPGPRRGRAQTRSRRRTSEVDSRRPGLREEQRGLAVAGSAARARALEVAGHGAQRGLTRRDDPRLRALALHAQLLGVEVDRGHVERDELLGPQARGVGDLEQRPVAQLERRRGRDAVEQRGHLVGAQHARQRGAGAWARAIRSAGLWAIVAVLAQRAVEGAQGGELAGDGRRHVRRSDSSAA